VIALSVTDVEVDGMQVGQDDQEIIARVRKKGNSGTGHGNRYLARVLGEAAVAASRTDSFLGKGTDASPGVAVRKAPSWLSGARS